MHAASSRIAHSGASRLLISAHRHLGDRIPGDTKWLLGSGVTALLAALALAFDLNGPNHRTPKGEGKPEAPLTISAEIPQPNSAKESTDAATSETGPAPSVTQAIDYKHADTSEEEPKAISATNNETAVYTPPSEEPEGEREEETEQPEATTEEAEGPSTTAAATSTTEASNTSTTATASTTVSEGSTTETSEASSEENEESTTQGGCDEE